MFFCQTGVHHPLFFVYLQGRIFSLTNYMGSRNCEISRLFCCHAVGAAMGAAAPGRGIRRGRREGAAGRAAGRGRGASALSPGGCVGTPGMPSPRGLAATSRPAWRACCPLLSREPVAPLPLPAALPAWCRTCRSLGGMPGRGCSHGCAWLAYLR